MSMLTTQTIKAINYKAVVVLSIAAYILGALWYSPILFEHVWMISHGYDRAQVDAILEGLVPLGFILSFVAYSATCFATALLCTAMAAESLRDGLIIGFTLWVGYAASIGLTIYLFSSSHLTAWLVDSAFQFVFLVGIGAILGAWRK